MLPMFMKILGLEFNEGLSGTPSDPTHALSLNPNPRSEDDQASTGDDNNR
jgi:hypothetical protein